MTLTYNNNITQS